MRVLFPIHLFYPCKVGGPANTVYWLCKALIKSGHEVTVVATKMGIDEGRVKLDEWVEIDGIKARYCNTDSKFSVSLIYHAIKQLEEVDSVVFSSICHTPNFIIALFARIKGKSIIWSPRGELFDSAVRDNKGKKMFFRIVRLLLGKHVLFHATSEAEEETIKNYFPESKVVIIPNYMELPERQRVYSDYKDFIYVGRIAPIKALGKLIDGLALSHDYKSSLYGFKFVGGVQQQHEDYYKGLLQQVEQKGLKDKVTFVGCLTGKEKFLAFASARYSFLVSNSENFGNVVIEALSQGTPVVASKGTPWESLPEEHAGFWIDNSPEIIAETLDNLISQTEEEYKKYREGALNYSKSFDVYEHVGEWEKALTLSKNSSK